MGCGASADADKNKSRSNEDPELMGKAKFLSCPSMSEVIDPAQVKWLVMVFAPLTHHGLIFVARNSKDGSLLVKDIPDKQVAREKDDQKVQLSYNLFFKAISTEVAKANKSGAKVEWMADGTMTIECKIAISGSTTTNKKADTYLAVLEPVPSTDANLFKYVLEPMATHYTKKRTDGWNLDRPDPHKEKLYGDQESNAILRAASMRVSQKVLDNELPNIVPLRQEYAQMRSERDVAIAKINLMKQMLALGTVKPPLLTHPPEDVFAPCTGVVDGFNVLAATQDPHLAYPTPNDALLAHPLTSAHDPLPAAEYHFKGDGSDYQSDLPETDHPLQSVAMASFSQLGLIGSGEGQFAEQSVAKFLYRIDCCHRRTNVFHNAKRAAERMHAFHCLISSAAQNGFKPSKEALGAVMVAAVIHDVDHCGLNNLHGSVSAFSAYVPTLYSFESHVERHSLAVGLAEAHHCGLRVNVDAVAAAVLATDLSKHQDFMLRFGRRVKEVADFSRRFEDQILAMSALLKAADLCHLYKRKDVCQKALSDLSSELRAADEFSGDTTGQSSTASGDPDLFVTHVAKPFFAAAVSAFPALNFITTGCEANFTSAK